MDLQILGGDLQSNEVLYDVKPTEVWIYNLHRNSTTSSTTSPSETPTKNASTTPTITPFQKPSINPFASPPQKPNLRPTTKPSFIPSTATYMDAPKAPTASLALLDVSNEASIFLGLINAWRLQNGVTNALKISPTLTIASQWMSTDMAQKNYFSHTDSLKRNPFVRLDSFGISLYQFVGENIFCGVKPAASAFAAFKNSPGHNANMLKRDYNYIGIGIAYNAKSSCAWYWTTDFSADIK
eukprot:gene12426-26139_t